MKHTQGEWKVKPYTKNQMMHKSMGGFNIVMNGQHIAALTQNLTMPLPEVEANAKLIAAAPELLEACILAIMDFDNEGGEFNKDTVTALRSAIKKATTNNIKSNTYEANQ